MRKTRILVVEDEAIIALHLTRKLAGAGFDICGSTGSGEDAVSMARTLEPDVVLMDINLIGEMDGIEAARNIGAFSRARIIFTTGHPDPEMRARAMSLNPAAYLDKPVEIGSIESAIRQSGDRRTCGA